MPFSNMYGKQTIILEGGAQFTVLGTVASIKWLMPGDEIDVKNTEAKGWNTRIIFVVTKADHRFYLLRGGKAGDRGYFDLKNDEPNLLCSDKIEALYAPRKP